MTASTTEAQIAVLQLQFQTDKEEMERDITCEQEYVEKQVQGRHEMARSRKDPMPNRLPIIPEERSQMKSQPKPNGQTAPI